MSPMSCLCRASRGLGPPSASGGFVNCPGYPDYGQTVDLDGLVRASLTSHALPYVARRASAAHWHMFPLHVGNDGGHATLQAPQWFGLFGRNTSQPSAGIPLQLP